MMNKMSIANDAEQKLIDEFNCLARSLEDDMDWIYEAFLPPDDPKATSDDLEDFLQLI